MRRLIWTAALPLTLLIACGGGQTTEDEVIVEDVEEEEVVAEEVEEEVDTRIFYVYWDGIHCLSIYPTAGPIRGEEPPNANATFSIEEHPEFSIISVYYEKEDWFAPVIDASSDLDDLLQRISEMELVEVQEDVNPVYMDGSTW